MTSPGARLRAAWSARPIMIPGAFNALTAKLAERLGFAAVYLSGGALSAGWAGVPDIGLLTLSEFADEQDREAELAHASAPPVVARDVARPAPSSPERGPMTPFLRISTSPPDPPFGAIRGP